MDRGCLRMRWCRRVECRSKKTLVLTTDSSRTNAGSTTSNNAIHLANNDLEWRGEWPRSEGLSVGSYWPILEVKCRSVGESGEIRRGVCAQCAVRRPHRAAPARPSLPLEYYTLTAMLSMKPHVLNWQALPTWVMRAITWHQLNILKYFEGNIFLLQ